MKAALARGPHKSAYEFEEFLREDMASMVEKNQWMVVPYDAVADVPGLRLSPIGVVPQHARRPRPIVDYSFYGVNDATQPNVPMDSMQFGQAFERLIRRIVLADPAKGPVQLLKVDLSDGFYRMWVSADDVPKLGVIFPSADGEPPLVALPIGLPMGWTNSPPAFATGTETAADITNQAILKGRKYPPHRLEPEIDKAEPEPPPAIEQSNVAVPVPEQPDPRLAHARRRPLQQVEVYIDDFIGAAQGNRDTLIRIRRAILHTLDSLFRPLEPGDDPNRQEPASVKKLRRGDATWATSKELLGWLINTHSMTLHLTERRTERLRALLYDEFPRQKKRCQVRDWHRLLGELRSMTIALPGARGLFSLLQDALRKQSDNRVALTSLIQSILDDFREIHTQLLERPTRLQELVPIQPTMHGFHDAAGHGAGGVWYPSSTSVARSTALRSGTSARRRRPKRPGPVVWRMRFPKDIQDRLVSRSNPHGDITNTDLELAGSIMHQECAVQCFDVRERTTLSRTDNTGTLFWQRKGSTTTEKVAADLLRHQALHQRYHRTVPLHDYEPRTLEQRS